MSSAASVFGRRRQRQQFPWVNLPIEGPGGEYLPEDIGAEDLEAEIAAPRQPEPPQRRPNPVLEQLQQELGRSMQLPRRKGGSWGAYESDGQSYEPSRTEKVLGSVIRFINPKAGREYFEQPFEEEMGRAVGTEKLGSARRKEMFDVLKAEREERSNETLDEQRRASAALSRGRLGELGRTKPQPDRVVDRHTNEQGQRVVTFQRADGSTYERVGGRVQPSAERATPEWRRFVELNSKQGRTPEEQAELDSLKRWRTMGQQSPMNMYLPIWNQETGQMEYGEVPGDQRRRRGATIKPTGVPARPPQASPEQRVAVELIKRADSQLARDVEYRLAGDPALKSKMRLETIGRLAGAAPGTEAETGKRILEESMKKPGGPPAGAESSDPAGLFPER